MDIEPNVEIEQQLPIFKKSEVFPEGYTSTNLVKVSVPPTNNNSEYDNIHNIVQFDIPCTYNALDPKELYFEGDIENPDVFPKEVDHSFHSLIKKIIVYNGVGDQIEIIEDYDWQMTLFFDMNLPRSERVKRRKNEGFGINKYGTDTAILWPKDNKSLYEQNTYEILKNLNTEFNFDSERLLQTQVQVKSKLPKLRSKDIDPFDIRDSMLNINEWSHVENGKLLPKPLKVKKSSTLHFKIPLMLRTIGAWFEPGREDSEYRLIPLGIFKGGVKILIFLNPTAFSVMTNVKEFEVLGLGDDLPFKPKTRAEGFYKLEALRDVQNPRRYTLKNAFINMEQYKLEPNQIQQLESAVNSGLYVRNFRELEELNVLYMKPYPVLQYTKNLKRNNIHDVLVAFTSELYKMSPFARQHDRYNKGIESVTFRLNGEVYPRPSLKRHNSLNTDGNENCNFFYAELRKGLSKHNYEQEYFLTKTNFAINTNIATNYALMDCISRGVLNVSNPDNEISNLKISTNPFNSEWREQYKLDVCDIKNFNEKIPLEYSHLKLKDISNLNEFIDPPASKTIYGLHLIDGESKPSEPGVDCELTCPITVEVKRLDNDPDIYNKYEKINYFMHVFVRYWSGVQLDGNGQTKYA